MFHFHNFVCHPSRHLLLRGRSVLSSSSLVMLGNKTVHLYLAGGLVGVLPCTVLLLLFPATKHQFYLIVACLHMGFVMGITRSLDCWHPVAFLGPVGGLALLYGEIVTSPDDDLLLSASGCVFLLGGLLNVLVGVWRRHVPLAITCQDILVFCLHYMTTYYCYFIWHKKQSCVNWYGKQLCGDTGWGFFVTVCVTEVIVLAQWATLYHSVKNAFFSGYHFEPGEVMGLLRRGADVQSSRPVVGGLISAASRGHLAIVRLLLEHGADVHDWNDHALFMAARKKHGLVVGLLLRHGADLHGLPKDEKAFAARIALLDEFVATCRVCDVLETASLLPASLPHHDPRVVLREMTSRDTLVRLRDAEITDNEIQEYAGGNERAR